MTKFLAAAAAAALCAGCGSLGLGGGGGGARAVADLQPTKGSDVRGQVAFAQRGDRVHVNARLSGLKPGSEHAFHVHEKGDCSSGDGMSAGGHYNPAGKPHGHPQSPEHHAGDMPNLRADASGNASASFDVTGMSVGGGSADIVGKGLIVHRDADDYRSQPAGNAGPRLACAVIRRG